MTREIALIVVAASGVIFTAVGTYAVIIQMKWHADQAKKGIEQ